MKTNERWSSSGGGALMPKMNDNPRNKLARRLIICSRNVSRLARLLRRDAVYYDAATMNEAVRTILPADSAAASESSREPDLGFLWDFWYPALRSTEIVGHHLTKAMLLL